MNTETIFFPPTPNVTDFREAHSYVTLDDKRFCLGYLESCPFCKERLSGDKSEEQR